MPGLDDVTQTFYANVDPYIASLNEAIAKAAEFAAANKAAAESVGLLSETQQQAAATAAEAAAATESLNDAEEGTAEAAAVAGAAQDQLNESMGDWLTRILESVPATEEYAKSVRDVMESSAEADGALAALGAELKLEADAAEQATEQNLLLAASQRVLEDSSITLGEAWALQNEVMQQTRDDAVPVQDGMNAISDATAESTVTLFGWTTTWKTIHWIIAGTAEILAVTLPAAIALGSAAFVMYQGVVEDAGYRLYSFYTTTEATASMMHTTTGDLLGLGNAFQTAQNAINPVAYELLGAYINAAKTNMTNFADAGELVAQQVGKLGAEIDIDLNKNAAEFASLIANMVPDLIEIGQIFGNLGHAILNLAADMPGLAEVLLRIIDGVTQLLRVVTSLPGAIFTVLIGMEEFSRWGGDVMVPILSAMGLGVLDVTAKWYTFARLAQVVQAVWGIIPMLMIRLGDTIATVGASLPVFSAEVTAAGEAIAGVGVDASVAILSLSTFATLGLAALGAGFGYLIAEGLTAKDTIQTLGDSLQKNIADSSNVDALNTITESMVSMSDAEKELTPYAEEAQHGIMAIGNEVKVANPQIAQANSYLSQMKEEFGNVVTGGLDVAKMAGTSLAGGLTLADMAGIKLNSSLQSNGKLTQQASQQIKNLLTGYTKMDQVGGILGADINATNIELGIQDSRVQTLNQAWDTFVSNATALTSTFSGLMTDVQQLTNVTLQSGDAFDDFGGSSGETVTQFAQSLQSFSGTSAQAWQNYDQAIQQAESYTDSLRTAATYGAVSQGQYAGQIAYTIQQLLPYAKYSSTAVEQLSAIAQEAGGPATSSYTTLQSWVNKTADSTNQFNQATQAEVGQLSDAAQAASEFGSTLQGQITTALATGTINADNLSGSMTTLVGDLKQGNSAGQAAAVVIGTQMLQAMEQAGLSSQTAGGLMVAAMKAAGIQTNEANILVQEMQQNVNTLASTIPKLNQTVKINFETSVTGSGAQYLNSAGAVTGNVSYSTTPSGEHILRGFHGLVTGLQGGGIIGGLSGIDSNLFALTAGEAVLNSRAVSALGGPLGVHSLNNQPSEAVLTGAGGAAGGGVINLSMRIPVMLNNQQVGQAIHTEQLTYDRRNQNANVSLNRPGRPG